MRERVTAEAIGRKLGLKRVGRQWEGPCPLCGGRNRFHATDGDDHLLLSCRKCEASFEDLLDAVAPREHVEPVRRWVWTGPDGEVTQTRPGPKGQKYHVPPRTKRSRYAYRADADAAGPWIVTEGAKAADAAAAKLPDCRVLAIASSAKAQRPDPDVYQFHGVTGEVILWPDADAAGHRIMNVVAADLQALGCEVRIIDPAALGLRGEGDDAHEWDGGTVDDVLSAARKHGKPNRVRAGSASGTSTGTSTDRGPNAYPTRFWTRFADVTAADSDCPPVLLPGLAWRESISMLYGESKTGKTTLLTSALAAAYTDRFFLGAQCGVETVGIVEEMHHGWLKRWLSKLGVGETAQIDFLPPVPPEQLQQYVEAERPDLLIVDTTVALTAFVGGKGALGVENDATAMRSMVDKSLRPLGCSVLMIHHASKDGKTYRGSSDLVASIDMGIAFRGDGDTRSLTYKGRWPQQEVTLTYSAGEGYRLQGESEYSVHERRVLAVVSVRPGLTSYGVWKEIGGSKTRTYDAINTLTARGRLLVEDGGLQEAVQ